MRSIEITSEGSSTTQITSGSRRSSAQIRQLGPSARLKHVSHSPIRSLTSVIASRQRERLLVARAEQVEGQPLSGATADAGQLRQLGDQPLYGRCVHARCPDSLQAEAGEAEVAQAAAPARR